MKHYLATIAFWIITLRLFGQLTPEFKTISVNADGTLRGPTNLWDQNQILKGRRFATLQQALQSNLGTTQAAVYIDGLTSINDGFQGWFTYDPASVASTNAGVIFAPTNGVGRLIRGLAERINVKQFGAKGDFITDDTAAVQAAANYADSLVPKGVVIFPPGRYVLSTVTVTNGGFEGVNDAMFTAGSQVSGSWLVQKVGATNDLLRIVTSPTATSGFIKNLSFLGRREQNLKNPITISSVSTRTNFVVPVASLPAAPASPSLWPYYGYAFFYTDANRYLGAGLVVGIDYGTGAISLAPNSDQYASATGSSGKLLTPGYKVCFSSSTTETASYKTTTGVDSTTAGYAAINFQATDPATLMTKWKVENVTIAQFHTGIRVGNVLANFFDKVWIRSCTFAGIAGAFPGDNRDSLYDKVFIQGFYTADAPGSTPTLDNPVFQRTLWGFYGLESSGNVSDISLDHSVNGMFVKDCLETRVGSVLFDGPVGHAIQFHGGLSSQKRPQVEFKSVMIRNGNEPTMVPDLGHPSYGIHVSAAQATYYIDSLYILRFGANKFFDAAFNQPFTTRGSVGDLWDIEGVTGETLYSAGTTSYPMILNRRYSDTRTALNLGGVDVIDYQSSGISTPLPVTMTGTGNLVVGNGKTSIRGTGSFGIDSQSVFFRFGADQGTGNGRTDLTAKDFRIYGVGYTNAEPNYLTIWGSSQATKNYLFIGGGDPGVRPITDLRIYTGSRSDLTGTLRWSIDENGDVVNFGKARFFSTSGPYFSTASNTSLAATVNGVDAITLTDTSIVTPLPVSMTGTGHLTVGNGRTSIFGTGSNGIDVGATFSTFGANQGTGTGRTDLTIKDARLSSPGYTNSEPKFMWLMATSQQNNNLLFIGGGDPAQRVSTEIRFVTGSRSSLTGTERMYVQENGDVRIVTKIRLGGISGPTVTEGIGAPSSSEPNGSIYLREDGTGPNVYKRENGAWVAL